MSSTFSCDCIFGTTLTNNICVPICGDDYVLSVEGCDDGNSVDGDGCNSSCLVETGWMCQGELAQGSTCKILDPSVIEYVGTIRDT